MAADTISVSEKGPGDIYVTVTFTPQSFSSTLRVTVTYSFDEDLPMPKYAASFIEKLTLVY